jgi:hypothetical protein
MSRDREGAVFFSFRTNLNLMSRDREGAVLFSFRTNRSLAVAAHYMPAIIQGLPAVLLSSVEPTAAPRTNVPASGARRDKLKHVLQNCQPGILQPSGAFSVPGTTAPLRSRLRIVAAHYRRERFRRFYFLCVKLKRLPEGSWNTASMP